MFWDGNFCSTEFDFVQQNNILNNNEDVHDEDSFIAGQLFLLFHFLLALSNWAKCLEAYSKKTTSRTRFYTNIFHIPEEDAMESMWQEIFFSCQTRTLDEILIYP